MPAFYTVLWLFIYRVSSLANKDLIQFTYICTDKGGKGRKREIAACDN